MTAFSLGTFGFPEVHADGRPIKLNLRKGLALLVYLAEAKGAVARDVIATLLWPEADRETGLARLRRLLHRVELALGEPVFETDRTSVRWSPAVELRSTRISSRTPAIAARLKRPAGFIAATSWRASRPTTAPEFDDWAFFRREALRGRLVHALERLVQDKNAAGDHFAATAHAGRLVELDPLSEVYGRHLIRSLLLSGDRSAAERHHAALTQRLRDELGVAPEAETEALMSPAAAPQARADDALRQGRRRASGVSDLRQRSARYSGDARLRVACGTRLGASREPDVSGVVDEARAPHRFRSPRHRTVRPGRLGAEHRCHR